MSYNYQIERQGLFTEQGQIRFIGIRDRVNQLIKNSGAFRLREAKIGSWEEIACVDRMVELGELVELERNRWGQYRVFTSPEVHVGGE